MLNDSIDFVYFICCFSDLIVKYFIDFVVMIVVDLI